MWLLGMRREESGFNIMVVKNWSRIFHLAIVGKPDRHFGGGEKKDNIRKYNG